MTKRKYEQNIQDPDTSLKDKCTNHQYRVEEVQDEGIDNIFNKIIVRQSLYHSSHFTSPK
jgi:hypothetical protein